MTINEYFQSFQIFTAEEIEQFIPLFAHRNLAKNDFFVREGEKCSEVAFIQSGIFRSYYHTSNGEETTYCFRFSNSLIAAYSSFITGQASAETMQAITPATFLVISKSRIDQLMHENPKWIHVLKIIAEQQYLELEHRVFQLQKESALHRYRELLKDQPSFILHIPLQYLASYLNVSQRHLSRIRKQIAF